MKYRDRRKPTDFEIVLHAGSDRTVLNVLDVSARGLRVQQLGVALEPEDDVSVEIRDQLYSSRVTWVKDGEAGLEFDRPLPSEIHALIAKSRTRSKMRQFLFRP